jgi:4-diphosphocytidyl-2-C-methyl-D-erythritol kinase
MSSRELDKKTIIVRAPAKVNLFLAVKRLRDDGYHDVEIVYQAIDIFFPNSNEHICDEIILAPKSHGIELVVDPPHLPTDQRNLCWSAARLLQERCNIQAGVYLRLRKRIPIGAGLGGGSSDAAATLVGLNMLWRLELSKEALAGYAAELGSDVPFFLNGGTALGRGRGEKLLPLKTPDVWLVIVWPGIHLSTPDVYSAYDDQPTRNTKTLPAILSAIEIRDAKSIAASLRNDLEEAACRLRPEIIEPLEYLTHCGMLGSQVSGSGSAIFGIAKDKNHAGEIASLITADLRLWAYPARTSPIGVQSDPITHT